MYDEAVTPTTIFDDVFVARGLQFQQGVGVGQNKIDGVLMVCTTTPAIHGRP